MLVFGLFDLMAALVLLAFFVSSLVRFLLPSRVARDGRTPRAWMLVASLAAMGLFILFNVAYFNGFGTDPVIGTPTAAQVAGTWVGGGGAKLVLRPNGTFTASRLPRGVGQPADFGVLGRNPAFGHGTWVIGRGVFNGPPESVIFTFTCFASGAECTNLNLTFDLQVESSSPSGGPALFWYLGDPDDWSNQYAFTRQ